MPRKAKFHPSVMQGGPGGEEDSWNNPTGEPEEEHDDPPAARREPEEDRFTAMEAELVRLREENQLIKRAIPPAEPTMNAPTQDEIDQMSDEDFDALLFSNPREALRLNNERVKRELRSEYTTNQGTNKFWEGFYDANADLKDDDDLVQSTLQKNMAELGDMPVDKAQKRLAELTRARILGFMKKDRDGGGRKRPMAEGASAPTGTPAPKDDEADEKPQTLGGLLKARKQFRRKAAQAA